MPTYRIKEGVRLMENGKPKGSANTKYNKSHTVLITARLNLSTDADILAFLESVPNKQGLIKELLRDYMTKYAELNKTETN